VNLKLADMIGESGDDHHKIERFLVDDDIRKRRELPSLTDLYDDMLDIIPDHMVSSIYKNFNSLFLETSQENRRVGEARKNNEKN